MEHMGNVDSPSRMHTRTPMLIRSIEPFLRRHRMAPTIFGRLAAQDPRLVFDLRDGREPGGAMEARCQAFMAGYEKGKEQAGAR